MLSVGTVLLFSNLLLASGLVGLGVWCARLVAQNRKLRTKQTVRLEKELAKAKVKADKLVADAILKAAEVLNEAQVTNSANEKVLADALATATTKITEKYSQTLTQVGASADTQIGNLASQVKKDTLTQIATFQTELEQQVVNFASQLKVSVDKAQSTADSQIAAYKQHKLAEFDSLVEAKVAQVSKDILGKSISASQHTELVIRALEQAKQEGVFGE